MSIQPIKWWLSDVNEFACDCIFYEKSSYQLAIKIDQESNFVLKKPALAQKANDSKGTGLGFILD